MPNAVDDALAGAKKALADTKAKNFPSTAPPANPYGKASYKMAKSNPAPAAGMDKEVQDTGKSINYNLKQRQAVDKEIDKIGK